MGCHGRKAAWITAVAAFLAGTCPGPVVGQEPQHEWHDAGESRTRRTPRRFDSRRQFSRDGSGTRYGAPAFDQAYQAELEQAYQRGLEDGRRLERYDVQAEASPSTYRGAMARGKGAFEDGNYPLAARQFLLAATLDQGDPASRLAASHALVALGSYEPAVRLLRRAFELQPRLAYLPLQIRGAYGNPEHFALHLTALREAAENDKNNPEIWFLLGYFGYYSDYMAEAADALGRAVKLRPTDELVQQLFELASLSVPRGSRGRAERKAQPRRNGR
ncbi:MAG: hypothetical protein ACE5EX_04680 [Phycisphaerae bacterium]